ncbi:Scr1 family TA system antitoxin-like transcriptional regulator, partial [Streptomyces agglomeratus]|uniref:Scr1 family TA system antitoxin-like transcriptional regulator n=1 Tax=Streptomyces agglomeratus TaxID=285458 RepID=UPI0030B8E59B
MPTCWHAQWLGAGGRPPMAANNDPTVRGAVVYLERFTSGLCLERPADVQQYSALYTHLQAQAHSPDHT